MTLRNSVVLRFSHDVKRHACVRVFSSDLLVRWTIAGVPLRHAVRLQHSGFYSSGNAAHPPPPPPPLQYGQPTFPPAGDASMGHRQDSYPALASVPLGTPGNPLVLANLSDTKSDSKEWSLWFSFLIFLGISYILTELQVFLSSLSKSSSEVDDPNLMLRMVLRESSPEPVNLDNLDVTFSTIRGCDEAKEELEDLVAFLKDPAKFTCLGGRLPKGVLLVGPPGCGKTLLAKAIAKEAGVSFFYASASEFDEMFVGVGSKRIREIFAAAKKASPAVIFIDEIDALATRRSTLDPGVSRMSLNQLLSEMDGFQSSSSVIVIAATNTPEVLDKAITRPGRLDTVIAVDPPDMKGRTDVVQLYLDKVKADSSVQAMDIARGTSGFTGAELSNLVNIAAIRAATLNRPAVTREDVEYAKDRVMMGAESQKCIPEEERRITAFHEGGHALAALLLQSEGTEPIHKATIVPRGSGVLGLVQQLPERDKHFQTKRQCLARLRVCLAGRVGEEMILGDQDVTTGASSDFQQASEMARDMIRRFGFSDRLGHVFFAPVSTADGAYISEETKKQIDQEVHSLVSDAYKDAKELIQKNQKMLTLIAEGLLQRETLTGQDIETICRGEALPPLTEKVTRRKSPNTVRKETTSATRPVTSPPIPIDCRTVPIS